MNSSRSQTTNNYKSSAVCPTTMADFPFSKPEKIHAFGQLSLFVRVMVAILPPLTNMSGTELRAEAETMYTVEGRTLKSGATRNTALHILRWTKEKVWKHHETDENIYPKMDRSNLWNLRSNRGMIHNTGKPMLCNEFSKPATRCSALLDIVVSRLVCISLMAWSRMLLSSRLFVSLCCLLSISDPVAVLSGLKREAEWLRSWHLQLSIGSQVHIQTIDQYCQISYL